MPLHRRSFLAAASASITLPLCNVFAADTPRPELKFLVITDTHLGYKGNDSLQSGCGFAALFILWADSAVVTHVVTTGRNGRVSAYHK